MKIIVLEHPRLPSVKRFNDIANTPLWSCLMGGYAAAALSAARFDTCFMDDARVDASFDQTRDRILDTAPDLLCVNAVYFWEHTPVLFDFLSEIKAEAGHCHINLFGFFPSLVFDRILTGVNAVDSVAVGEFEITLVELAKALDSKGHPGKIKGLAQRPGLGDFKVRPPHKDLDDFAFPERSCLEGTVSILASRGCYNHCSFCPVPPFYNRGSLWRGRSPENIALEIQGLKERGVTSFYFCDPNFIGPGAAGKKRIMDLMVLIKPMNIRFGMETRPQDLDDDLMEKMVEAGFESLLMGVESGSDNLLNRIDKCSGTNQAARAVSLCRKHGIEPEIGFLMFIPDSTLFDLRCNMTFLMENRLLDRLDRTANLLSHSQIVLAGTSGYHWFEKQGRLQKSGVFGFEANAFFTDPAVAWVARLLTFACHLVLKNMQDTESRIYWKKEGYKDKQAVNDYLVHLSFSLMDQAGSRQNTMDAGPVRHLELVIQKELEPLF